MPPAGLLAFALLRLWWINCLAVVQTVPSILLSLNVVRCLLLRDPVNVLFFPKLLYLVLQRLDFSLALALLFVEFFYLIIELQRVDSFGNRYIIGFRADEGDA